MNILLQNTYLLLSSKKTVCTVGFGIGFLYNFKFNRKTLVNPLSTIFGSAIEGVVTCCGAVILSEILPPPLLLGTTLLGLTSCGYYISQNIK